MNIGKKKVCKKLIEEFRDYFADVPDSLTADEALEYAIYCRGLDGEGVAYKEIMAGGKKSSKKEEDKALLEACMAVNKKA
jgi:hypothetical protein